MKYRVVLQPRAAEQLEEQYQHIARQNPRSAANWFNRFVSALQGLSHNPQRCAVARESELVGREIRQFLFGRRAGTRRVFFVIEGKTVHVLAVRHSAQPDITPEELLG
jgi:plasmid stabilization system protein ParE